MSHDVKVDTPQINCLILPMVRSKKKWRRSADHDDCLKNTGLCGFIPSAVLWMCYQTDPKLTVWEIHTDPDRQMFLVAPR